MMQFTDARWHFSSLLQELLLEMQSNALKHIHPNIGMQQFEQ